MSDRGARPKGSNLTSPLGAAEFAGNRDGHPRTVALVPAWQAAEFIAATLDLLAAQTYPALEILISDDASSDRTAEICAGYAARDPRFRLLRQPRNLGWTGNVNALLREARGDYLLFAFQDDWLAPDYIERCVAALEANPDAILAFSDITLVEQDGTRVDKSYITLDGVTERARRGRGIARQIGSWWIPNRGVFRARAAAAIGGLRRHRAGEFSADWPWLLHLSLLGGFIRVPERLVTKIYRTQSLSRSWSFDLWSWSAVTLSALGVVARAELAFVERLAIAAVLARFLSGQARIAVWRGLGSALRRAGLRSSRRTERDGAGRSSG